MKKPPLTGFRAEAIGFVLVIILSCCTPAIAVISARGGAAVILLTLEGEGEFTWGAIGVSTQGEEHCNAKVERNNALSKAHTY